ncbi:MAG: hypothetical protein JXR62_05590 [Bacilli bacterium]|nr:hypothetical protein [Bacilli bacterium]
MKKTLEKSKIKIVDDIQIRQEIVDLLEIQDIVIASKWAINNAIRTLETIGIEKDLEALISRGIACNQLCINQQINVHELRQIGFDIHRYAKHEKNAIKQSALRAFGHAVSTAHMKNHAIVASDYIIKVLNLSHDNNIEPAAKERQVQLQELLNLQE